MGCFLGCFGGSKDAKRRKRKEKFNPRDQRHIFQSAPRSTIFTEEVATETRTEPVVLVQDLRSEVEEPLLGPSTRKRVTFDSNVTTHEPVSINGSVESLPDTDKFGEKGKKESVVSSRGDNPGPGGGSVVSSVGSYPPNHRYQNCRESDDEAEECGDSDLDDENEDEEKDENDVWCESVMTASTESSAKNLIQVNNSEVESVVKLPGLDEQEAKINAEKGFIRDRSVYVVHSVLNPVENLTQWKAVRSNGNLPSNLQKENFTAEHLEEPRASLSTDPTSKQSPSSFGSKSRQQKSSDHEVGVDTSLSNWLASRETTPQKEEASRDRTKTMTPERSSTSRGGSNSARSFEDRPILGALTLEELKQLSAASSTRRSPSRSPDDMPIIGTVGSYWSHSSSGNGSKSASSFKGIPNTTSKYREDKRVNWHSTPFETRLERALKRDAAEA